MDYNKYFISETSPLLNQDKLDAVVRHALVEDIGRGDITTQLTIPEDKQIEATLLVREECVICGLEVAERVFNIVDKEIKLVALVRQGQLVKSGKTIAEIAGRARNILSAERVALNLLTMLCGIATQTREYVKRIEPYKTKITDTRKTLPGLRELQKYAVRVGGGYNHRMGLDEMILIKDNHIKVTDGYSKLPSVPKGFMIEIEVQNLEEFKHALKFKPDVIMLDNMHISDIKKAVKIRDSVVFNSHHPKTKLETSGNIDLANVRKVAATGVDIISIGALTHSVRASDISLEVI
ncbi:carboxylating nicotinate-nucleotide diphosphorylase [bacterium]|nr:MAG: carboxylating nicotinate-nucleotide diphosphorylase [bacterium]